MIELEEFQVTISFFQTICEETLQKFFFPPRRFHMINKLRIEKRHHSANMMHTLSQYFVSLAPVASVSENVEQNKSFA
jgi:hypothetical protein